jgi:hypothetical protein
MKKSPLVLLLILASLQMRAQDQVMFKLGYLPGKNYAITKDMKMDMTMTPPTGGGDIAMKMSSNSTSTIATGKADAGNVLPFKFSSKVNDTKLTMNGQDMPSAQMPNTTMEFYGKYLPTGRMQIDSVIGKKTDDSLKSMLNKMIDMVINGVKFPDHPLKVGETFVQEMPFSLPLPGVGGNNNMTVKVNYKLLSIANNTAVFDLTETMDFTIDMAAQGQTVQMKMNGLGTGSLNYDITKQFFSTMTTNMNMTFNMNVGAMTMTGKAAVSTVDKTEITTN